MENFSEDQINEMISEIKSKKRQTKFVLVISISMLFFEFFFLLINKFKLDYMFLFVVLFLLFQIYMGFIKSLEQNVTIIFLEDLKKHKLTKKK
jgi:hypothetical protein